MRIKILLIFIFLLSSCSISEPQDYTLINDFPVYPRVDEINQTEFTLEIPQRKEVLSEIEDLNYGFSVEGVNDVPVQKWNDYIFEARKHFENVPKNYGWELIDKIYFRDGGSKGYVFEKDDSFVNVIIWSQGMSVGGGLIRISDDWGLIDYEFLDEI